MEVYGKDEKMKIGIIGLGLIGGSMAIDLKRRGFADSLTGVEADSVNAAAAQKIGLVDRVVSLEECVRECELIVLAVPVGSAVRMLPEILVFRSLGCDVRSFRRKGLHNLRPGGICPVIGASG